MNIDCAYGKQRLDNAHRTVCRKDAATKPPGKDLRRVRRALSRR
ncbi:hypothetical protein [Zooshikella sp. RANM57]